jgi:type II secretory pathway pseudopilin PulG
MMSEALRPRATLLPCLVAAVVIGLLAALLMPVIADMREAGRRTQCLDNLRQLSLAIREYHEAHSQLPPLATDEGHWTWAALLVPHLPDVRERDGWDVVEPASAEANAAWVERFRLAVLYCPSRRSELPEPESLPGQPTDYVAVSTTADLLWNTRSNGPIVVRAQPPTREQPLRSVTRLRSLIDGESSTAILAEKHMRRAWLWGPNDQPALVARNDPNTVRIASNIEANRFEVFERPRGLVGDDEDDDDPYKFGGPHPGVCFFAMADASARPVRNSTDPRMLRWLCGRNDGETVLLNE